MRINPISVAYNRQNLKSQNQNNRQQNVSFGMYESEETKRHFKEDILTSGYRTDDADMLFDYFDKSNLVTIKRKNGLTYAAAERDAINKHENKEFLEDMILLRYRLFKAKSDKKNLTATIDNVFCDFERDLPEFEKKASIVKSEPGYLDIIEDSRDAFNLYSNLRETELDIITRTLRECKRNGIYKEDNFNWNKFVRISKFNPEEKLVSFEFTKDPFNKDEKPPENLGKIKRYFFNRELQNRQRQHVRYRQILNDFRKEYKLDNNWRTNIDCSTEDGMKRLRLIIELSDKLYDTFFPPAPEKEKYEPDSWDKAHDWMKN